MSKRNKFKQIWADEDFYNKLKELKAKRVLIGTPVNNITQLTREILMSDSFKEVEKELLGKKKRGIFNENFQF